MPVRVFRTRSDAWTALQPLLAPDERAQAIGWIVPRRRWLTVLAVMFATSLPLLGWFFELIGLALWMGRYQTIYAFCLTDRRLLLAPARYPWHLVVTDELQAVPRDTVSCAWYSENALHSYLDLVIRGVRSDWVASRQYRADARALGALRNPTAATV